MKYYHAPVYKATVVDMEPFVDIENVGEMVVAKGIKRSVVIDPTTGVEISIQKSRYTVRGLYEVNSKQITQNGFYLFVYQEHLTDGNQIAKDSLHNWFTGNDCSRVCQCDQKITSTDSVANKSPYQKTMGKRGR